MLIVGLTGSIGMGKSTTSQMFRDFGIPVHDADATVHALYAGIAVPMVEAAFPGTALEGRIDRARLAGRVLGNPVALQRLENLIHPLVTKSRHQFLEGCSAIATRMALLDIPLLFETGCESEVDLIVVVTAADLVQRRRVMSRQGMTEDRFAQIMQKQWPDMQKRRRAHAIIRTDQGLDGARRQVQSMIRSCVGMAGRVWHA